MSKNTYIQFSPAEYETRRNILLEKLRNAGITTGLVMVLGLPQPYDSISDHPLSDYGVTSSSDFTYYVGPTGIPASASHGVLIDIQTGETKLYGKDLTPGDLIWTGKQVKAATEVSHTLGLSFGGSLDQMISDAQKKDSEGKLYYMPMIASDQILTRSMHLHKTPDMLENGAYILNAGSGEAVRKAIIDQRLIKSHQEILLMRNEGDVTTTIHTSVIEQVRKGNLASEEEVYAYVIGEIAKSGKVPSFPPIITTQGAVLHNRERTAFEFKPDDLLLLDFGTKDPVSGVCADQTSTIRVLGAYSQNQSNIQTLVNMSHQAALDTAKAGIRFEEVHKAAALTITQGLLDYGIFQGGTAEELVEKGVHTLLFPHGLGHAIGLDTHDLGDHNEMISGYPDIKRDKANNPLHRVRFNRILEVGHCFTIEPGIYFIESLKDERQNNGTHSTHINRDLREEYAKEVSGIRYEECYFINPQGVPEKLGTIHKPSSVQKIEKM